MNLKDFFTSKISIIEAMQKARKPLILQHIAKKSRLTPQLVSYHLKLMIEWGIINVYQEQEKTLYVLQAAYYDEGWLEALCAVMTPYLKAMSRDMDLSQIQVQPAKALIRNLAMFLRLFEKKIEKIIKEKNSTLNSSQVSEKR